MSAPELPAGDVAEPPPDHPSRATLVKWLKVNLGVTMGVGSIVCTIFGGVVATTLRYADFSHSIEGLQDTTRRHDAELVRLRADMVDVDRRFNSGGETINELRRARDSQQAALEQRVAVLEAQLRFLAERTQIPPGRRGTSQ